MRQNMTAGRLASMVRAKTPFMNANESTQLSQGMLSNAFPMISKISAGSQNIGQWRGLANESKRRAAFEQAKQKKDAEATSSSPQPRMFDMHVPPQRGFMRAATDKLPPGYGWADKSLTKDNLAESRAASHEPITGDEFRARATRALENIRIGFENLQSDNKNLVLSAESEWDITAHLAGSDIKFSVEIDPKKFLLTFTSPESGGRTYYLDSRSDRWRDQLDGHGFDGLLTRDVMRHVYGVPNFSF